MNLSFSVEGTPVAKGSMKAFMAPISKKCHACGNAKTRAVVTHDSKKTKPWQLLVSWAAKQEMAEQRASISEKQSLCVDLRFFLARPKVHMRTKGGEVTDIPKANAPQSPSKKPDIDKLARCVLDAMQGVVYDEDSRIVGLTVVKFYADTRAPGVEVFVEKSEAL